MTIDDLATARVWTKHGLHYDFGRSCPEHSSEVVESFVRGVVDARKVDGGKFVLRHDAAGAVNMLNFGKYCVDEGFLQCTSGSADGSGLESTWDFTAKGIKHLTTSVWLRIRSKAFKPRPNVALEDMTNFELMAKLQSEGWSMSIPLVRSKRSALSYSNGCTKEFWIREKSQALPRCYAMALLDYDRHLMPVLPFGTDAYYKCIMSGKPYVKATFFV